MKISVLAAITGSFAIVEVPALAADEHRFSIHVGSIATFGDEKSGTVPVMVLLDTATGQTWMLREVLVNPGVLDTTVPLWLPIHHYQKDPAWDAVSKPAYPEGPLLPPPAKE